MEALAGKLIASEGSEHPRHEHARPARGACRRRLRDRRDRRGRHGRVGERHRDPGRYGIVMHVADSIGPGGIMRAFRNAPVLARGRRATRRGRARRVDLQLHEPRADRGAGDAHGAPAVQVVRALLLHRHTRAAPSGWPSRRASSPSEIAMPPVVAGINHCAAFQSSASGRHATRCRSCASARGSPVVQLGARDVRRAALLLGALDGVLPADAAPRGALRRPAQGVRCATASTTHDMDYERARVARLGGLAASGRPRRRR